MERFRNQDKIYGDFTEAVYTKVLEQRFGLGTCCPAKDADIAQAESDLLDWLKIGGCINSERTYRKQVSGFGGSSDLCVGATATFFIDKTTIGIGTKLFEGDELTPVSFTLFRDDATGIIYSVVNGVVTGISTTECSQLIQICDADSLPSGFEITGVSVSDDSLIYVSSTNFPIDGENCGLFKTSNSSPGLKTVKVTVTGGSQIDITDSNGNVFTIPVTGPGTYSQTGVYVSGPNTITNGASITLS